jgi:hypothetical protein
MEYKRMQGAIAALCHYKEPWEFSGDRIRLVKDLKRAFLLLLCWVWVHLRIYKGSYNVSNMDSLYDFF